MKSSSLKHSGVSVLFLVSLLLTSLIGLAIAQDLPLDISAKEILDFNSNWRFIRDDPDGAEHPGYDDSGWEVVQLPHDWSIEGPIDRENPTGRGGGYLPAGIGWYRKQFSLPESFRGKKVFVEFDGIMANSRVWVNGQMLGHRPNGYVSFRIDLTPHLHSENEGVNVLAVRADNSLQPASRWYTGAGIYRHTRLVVTNPVNIAHWGVFVTTPEILADHAMVKASTRIINSSSEEAGIRLRSSVIDPSGRTLQVRESALLIKTGEAVEQEHLIRLDNPERWDIKAPNLYALVSQVMKGEKEIDRVVTTFGIREFEFKPATGFWLNGRNLKIYGVCLHHDGGAFGAAVPLSVWERRLEALRKAGVNAIRTAHNPVAPEFLDLCDRMGFLVMNETFDTWTEPKNHAPYGYNLHFNEWWEADTRDVVLRDRNHPCIIAWSVGNEIRENLTGTTGFQRYRMQQDLIHSLDPTRPVTMALFRPNFPFANVYNSGFSEMMDIAGQNYRPEELVDAYHQNPERKVLGTENGHDLQTWLILRDNPFMSGQFLWTGIDYLGEADWPRVSYDFGLIDRTARLKPRAYQRMSWWSDIPMVHVVRHEKNAGAGELVHGWTPADMDTYDQAHLEVYSNCEEVELFLNGISKGTMTKPENDSPRKWIIPFNPGTLKAVGRNNGVAVAGQENITAGEPAKIRLESDRQMITNDWHDVAHVVASITDRDGVLNPNADNLITFEIEGPGKIVAVDNGSLTSHEPFQASERRTYQGQCIVFVQAKKGSGEIVLKAVSPDLESHLVIIEVKE